MPPVYPKNVSRIIQWKKKKMRTIFFFTNLWIYKIGFATSRRCQCLEEMWFVRKKWFVNTQKLTWESSTWIATSRGDARITHKSSHSVFSKQLSSQQLHKFLLSILVICFSTQAMTPMKNSQQSLLVRFFGGKQSGNTFLCQRTSLRAHNDQKHTYF